MHLKETKSERKMSLNNWRQMSNDDMIYIIIIFSTGSKE